jgi:hypothetical protein
MSLFQPDRPMIGSHPLPGSNCMKKDLQLPERVPVSPWKREPRRFLKQFAK